MVLVAIYDIDIWYSLSWHNFLSKSRLAMREQTHFVCPYPDRNLSFSSVQQMDKVEYKEIGDMLGCSEGAVKVKVFRALQELKSVYEQLEKQM